MAGMKINWKPNAWNVAITAILTAAAAAASLIVASAGAGKSGF